MSFLDNLGKKIGYVAQLAVKKSGEFIEIQKININIKSEEHKLDKLYLQLGKLIYTKYCSGYTFDDNANEICDKLRKLEKNITKNRDKIAEVKKIRKCVICGEALERLATVCQICGSKQDISLMPVKEEKKYHGENRIICQVCLQSNLPKTKYCVKCGNEVKR